MKPLTEAQKAKCVLFMHETKSPSAVQRKFRSLYNTKDAPSRAYIKKWYDEFQERGNMLGSPTGRKPLQDITVQNVKTLFEASPKTSVRQGARELNLTPSAVHKTLRKTLRFYPYKIKLVHAMKPEDGPARVRFAGTMLENVAEDDSYLNNISFSDEATFHVSGIVNRHNVRIWGIENPRAYLEQERNSPKVNVWCALLHNRVIGPFFFTEQTVTQDSYLAMLEEYAYPQLAEVDGVIFQQDGAPPHWGLRVRESLDRQFPGKWIGRGGPIPWPARSPDVTPLDFFFWGYVKDRVYQTPIRDIEELKRKIVEVVATVNRNMLKNTWKELRRRLEFLQENDGIHYEVYR